MNKDFKKGQWLIRIWKNEDIDLIKFKCYYGTSEFLHYPLKFFRINGKKLVYRGEKHSSSDLPLLDSRLSTQLRKPTKKELSKYSKVILNNI